MTIDGGVLVRPESRGIIPEKGLRIPVAGGRARSRLWNLVVVDQGVTEAAKNPEHHRRCMTFRLPVFHFTVSGGELNLVNLGSDFREELKISAGGALQGKLQA